MFSSLLFLILLLLLVNLAPEAELTSLSGTPWEGFSIGMGIYALLLLGILLQNFLFLNRGKRLKGTLLLLTNIELLLFFTAYHFLFLGHRLYVDTSDPSQLNLLLPLVSLGLYFIGLGVFHFSGHRPLITSHEPLSRRAYTVMQLRFLLPFTIPFLAFELLFDILEVIPSTFIQEALTGRAAPLTQWTLFGGLMLFFVVTMLLFLPPVIQSFWGCELLGDSSLKQRLDHLCKKANFRHGGLKIWTVMNHSITAAIIGVIPRFRYIMFTEGLLRQMPPEQIEAILAHEIGHSQKHHLLVYPFVILGMLVVTTLFSLLFGEALLEFLALRKLQAPDSLLTGLTPMVLFVPLALIAIFYFRFVFGFFSRNFERQADLHVFELGVHPENLIGALHGVAVATGGTHNVPNWHHYSIQQRIDYLKACMQNPEKVIRHHRRVKRILRSYLFLLLSSIPLLILSQIPGQPLFTAFSTVSGTIQEWSNAPFRTNVVNATILRYELPAENDRVKQVLEHNLKDYTVSHVPGVLEYYSAQDLAAEGEIVPALKLMRGAWLSFNFDRADPSVLDEFKESSRAMITVALDQQRGYVEINDLIEAMLAVSEGK